ncbi:hypothetical protein CPT_Melville_008 [Salmonella phage Melville]|uniref:Uncharacterized protein n=1 Tax=Salmonella phage Melville TaxID=2041413 RepID=A0A2D1GLP0_9CAUD|nr:hypothetical protein FDI73_gp008 [Salmonella phage Melville]ATN92982.1 hypothetical protein CPT_Melville_008 [Salmonella phage Melville]UPW42382.1 hypothetical protein EBPHNEJP_00084 [Salmonella phage CF-SP2]
MTTQNLEGFVEDKWYSIRDYVGFAKAHKYNEEIIDFIEKNGGFFRVIYVNPETGNAEAAIMCNGVLVGDQDTVNGLPGYLNAKVSDEYFFILREEAKYFKLETGELIAANDDEYESSDEVEENEVPHITLVITNKSQAMSAIKLLKGLL